MADGDGHRWHDADYVAGWIARYEGQATPEYQAAQRRRLDRIVALLRSAVGTPATLLDLGVGWGRLARRLLDELPGARIVGCDFSRPMLDAARCNLASYGDRVELVELDLGVPGSIAELGLRCEAVVTTATLHHVRRERVATLYREVYETLAPGGIFLDLDRVRRRTDAWLAVLRRPWTRGAVAAADYGATRAQHLRMLRRAGFAVAWERLEGPTLLVARKAEGRIPVRRRAGLWAFPPG